MRSVFLLLIMVLIISFTGCEKMLNDTGSEWINVILNNSDEYRYDLGISGDEEGARIITPAGHAEKSELLRDATTNWNLVYLYKAESAYTGNDVVEIETCTGGKSEGCTDMDTIRFSFTITN